MNQLIVKYAFSVIANHANYMFKGPSPFLVRRLRGYIGLDRYEMPLSQSRVVAETSLTILG